MPTIEPTFPLPDDTIAAKITLAVLLVAWFALVGWSLANGERLSAPLKPLLARIASVTSSPVAADASPPAPAARRSVPESADGERTGSPDERSGPPEPVEPSMEPGTAETPEPAEPTGRAERADQVERAESLEEPGPVVTDNLPVESLSEARRTERLGMLSELGSELQFSPGSDVLGNGLREPLEQVFEILFLYPDTAVDIVLESNEHADAASDLLLGRARAQAIVDYLVSRGLERGRFALDIGVGDALPFGEHRVRVRAEDDSR